MRRRAGPARDCCGKNYADSSVAEAMGLAPETNPETASTRDIDLSARLLAGTGDVGE
jgi:hypothetical protein